MRRISSALVFAALGAGCGMGLDLLEEVEDLRVLAIRADPPQYLVPADPDTGLDFGALDFSVQFDALVVDPRGQPVEVEWSFCPVESSRACRDFSELAAQSPDYEAALTAMRQTTPQATAVPGFQALGLSEAERGKRAIWPYDIPTFTFEAPDDLALYHAETNFFGFGAGSWPFAVLRVTAPGEKPLTAIKRISLGVEDLAAVAAPLVERFDVALCPNDGSEGPEGCLDFEPQTANNNPVFARIEVAFSDLADADFVEVQKDSNDEFIIPEVRVGEFLRIRPVFSDDSFETYQEIDTTLGTGALRLVETREEISVSWYITGGEIQDQLTWPLFTRTLDTVFTAPDEVPEGELVSVFMVANDQRFGSAWQQLEVRIIP